MAKTNFNAENLENNTPEQIFIAFSNLTSQNVEPSCEDILHYYNTLNKKLGISHLFGVNYFEKLKESINNNIRAKNIWEILDRKAANTVYRQQSLCKKHRIAIVGAGPIGLRMAIEGLLLGAEVHVIEKRTSFARNNVAHLWHFTIEDFKMLCVKKLFGGFCAGNINHISIRRIQCIFLQVSLMLGVHFHAPLEYIDILEPDKSKNHKWRLKLDRPEHEIAGLDFDFIVAADGARTKFRTLIGHVIKPGKLCLGITANYRNNRTQKEMEVQSIAGVAAIYDQQFFRSLKTQKDVELENIVYYKDDTHYFVMTARKKNLLAKNVLKSGEAKELGDLCRKENVNYDMLYNYVQEVNDYATGLELDFIMRKDGRPDVSLFDFSRRAVSTNACRMFQKDDATLTVLLVGDSLIEPFWPLGTGLALGVLTVMDTAWFIKGFAEGVKKPAELIAERESLFKLLNSEFNSNNLLKPFSKYTIDPTTRYPNHQIPKISQQMQVKYSEQFIRDIDRQWPGIHTASTTALNSDLNVPPSPHPAKAKQLSLQDELQSKFQSKSGDKKEGNKSQVDKITEVQSWFKENLSNAQIQIDKANFHATFQDGNAFAVIISRYRPDLLEMKNLKGINALERLEKVFKIADENFGISPMFSASKFLFHPDKLEAIHYLIQWHDYFKDEAIAKSKHTNTLTRMRNHLTFKRKHGGTRKENKVRPDAKSAFMKSQEEQNSCRKCSQYIMTTEKISVEGFFFHRKCFTCEFPQCTTHLTSNNCSVYHNEDDSITFLCPYHFNAIESADNTTGCNTLKHAKKFADFTTEQIVTQAYAKERAMTMDDLNDSQIPIKEILPIISNHDNNRDRAISQPLLDSPTLPQKFSPQHKSRYENKAKDASNSLTSFTKITPENNIFPKSAVNSMPPKSPVKIPDPPVIRVPIKPIEKSPPFLPKVEKLSPKAPQSHPYMKFRKESLVTENKPHLPESLSETILSAPPSKHKKSSYEPKYDFGNNPRRFSSFVHLESDLLDEFERSSSHSSTRYPSPAHKSSLNDLLGAKDHKSPHDVGPRIQVFHRYNKIFKAQSSEALLGSINSTNEHFSRSAIRKHSNATSKDYSEKQRRLSEVEEAIAKHPTKSRNSIEVQALTTEQLKLSKEIASAIGDDNGPSSRSSTLTRGQVGETKIQPDTCQHVAISIEDEDTEPFSPVIIINKLPVPSHDRESLSVDFGQNRLRSVRVNTNELPQESESSVITPTDPGVAYRPRLDAHSGQNALYRSKRYRSTRTSNIVSERKSVDAQLSLTSANSEDDDSDAMQEENQREQDAFRRALELDQRMDLVQQKIARLEDRGKYYENQMRNADGSIQEGRYLQLWSEIINEKNQLVRQDRDLSLEFKEHQLNDEFCRVENELRKKQEVDKNLQGVESKALLNEKISIVSEMDDLVQRIESERINDNEEDEHRKSILPSALENFSGIMADAVYVPPPNSKYHYKY